MSDSKKGINWMYQDAASKEEQKKNEEESYLLGKEYNCHQVDLLMMWEAEKLRNEH